VPFAPERGFSAAAPITRQFTRLGVEPDTRVRVCPSTDGADGRRGRPPR